MMFNKNVVMQSNMLSIVTYICVILRHVEIKWVIGAIEIMMIIIIINDVDDVKIIVPLLKYEFFRLASDIVHQMKMRQSSVTKYLSFIFFRIPI